jgi:predicted nucleotidyltransferase
MISQQRIQEYADRVAEAFHPDKIILFGSYAYGEPNEDSDVDLLVVMEGDKIDRKKMVEIQMEVRETFPLDLLVYDPAHLSQRASMEDWFVREVLEKGRVLYENHHAGVGG